MGVVSRDELAQLAQQGIPTLSDANLEARLPERVGAEPEVERYDFDLFLVERVETRLQVRVSEELASHFDMLPGKPVTPPSYYECDRYQHPNWVEVFEPGMDCEDPTPEPHPLRG